MLAGAGLETLGPRAYGKGEALRAAALRHEVREVLQGFALGCEAHVGQLSGGGRVLEARRDKGCRRE